MASINVNTNEKYIKITSFRINNSKTTGMKDGKYVVGTKLYIEVKVTSTYGTKTVRMIGEGAKVSDNSWGTGGGTTIGAISTAVAVGIIHATCIVTDRRGYQAIAYLDVKIEGDEDDYYAYYFFGNKFKDSFNSNVHAIRITLYNIYEENSDPPGKTIECYAHNYRTYNEVKNIQHNDNNITYITSFTIPDVEYITHTTFELTNEEAQILMRHVGGLAFKIKNSDFLTVHDTKCTIELIFE